MSSQSSKGSDAIRPGFARLPASSNAADRDDNDKLQLPKRAQTFHNESTNREQPGDGNGPDAFDTAEHSENEDNTETARPSVELDVLPIELITLTDRYVDSNAFYVGTFSN